MYASEPVTPIEVLSHSEHCVVCGDAADGFHYGVRSCRGCNAFFRRAVTFNMTFSCRRGGRCPVDKNARCACRACRLAKCFAVGMDRKAVQPKRDLATNGQCSSFDGDPDFEMRNMGIAQSSPNYDMNDMTSPGSAFTPLNGSMMADYIPALPPSPPPESSAIFKQCFDFVEQKRRRRAMLCNSLEDILTEVEMILKHPACAEDFTTIFQTQMILMFEWVEKLSEFRLLHDPNDKTKLLRAFALRYLLLDNVYHTYELGYTDRLVLVNNTFIVPGQPSTFTTNEMVDDREVRQLMFGYKMQELITDLVHPMSRRNMLFGEIMTLRRLMFWNPGKIGLSPFAESIAGDASNTAMKELQQYLEHEAVDDIDKRMEFLLLLLPFLTKHTKTMYEIVRLIPSFGKMSEWNSFMDDVLKGV